MSHQDESITTTRAARILDASENTVRQLADKGVLPFTRVGHFRVFKRVDVERLASERAEHQAVPA